MTAAATRFATVDLARFLLARVDEDEKSLRALVRRTHRAGDHDHELSFARAQCDLTAKRQVLGHLQHLLVLRDLPAEKPVRDLAAGMLRSMAGPYTRHPQFRTAWDGGGSTVADRRQTLKRNSTTSPSLMT
jgi:hypothetical protein